MQGMCAPCNSCLRCNVILTIIGQIIDWFHPFGISALSLENPEFTTDTFSITILICEVKNM